MIDPRPMLLDEVKMRLRRTGFFALLHKQLAWQEEYTKWKEKRLAEYRQKKEIFRKTQEEMEEEECMEILAEIGVPFDPMGEPIGIRD